jgi:hypothetical protein
MTSVVILISFDFNEKCFYILFRAAFRSERLWCVSVNFLIRFSVPFGPQPNRKVFHCSFSSVEFAFAAKICFGLRFLC